MWNLSCEFRDVKVIGIKNYAIARKTLNLPPEYKSLLSTVGLWLTGQGEMHYTILAFKKGLSSKLEKRLHMYALYFQISSRNCSCTWSERRSSILLILEVHLQLYLSLCYANSSNTSDYTIGTWFIGTSIPLPCRKGIAEGTKHKGIHTITKVKYSLATWLKPLIALPTAKEKSSWRRLLPYICVHNLLPFVKHLDGLPLMIHMVNQSDDQQGANRRLVFSPLLRVQFL